MDNREGACGFIASTISPFFDCCPRSITGRIKSGPRQIQSLVPLQNDPVHREGFKDVVVN